MTKELFVWPETAAELLQGIESYERHHAQHPRLGLVIFGRTATRAELKTVLSADDKLAAASVLFVETINLLD